MDNMLIYANILFVKSDKKKRKIRLGKTQQKILLLLFGGIALGLSGSPKRYFQILNGVSDDWKEIDKRHLKRAVEKLYESKLIEEKENKDGTTTITLSEEGVKRALTFDLDKIKIKKPKKWDGKWRIVLFDVPEKKRVIRDALRHYIQNVGMYEYQKSVFISPYDCKDEIEYIIEVNEAKKFVRFVVADSIDNELHFKTIFGLKKEDT